MTKRTVAVRTGDDRAPGGHSRSKRSSGATGYLVGYALAMLVTGGSFAIVAFDLVWPPAVPPALVALAVAQMAIHLIFFLHITSAPDNAHNTLALAFGTLVAGLVIFGSVWIMSHLDDRLMPMTSMMDRMR